MSSPSTSALACAAAQRSAVPFRERSRVRAGNYAVDAVFSHTAQNTGPENAGVPWGGGVKQQWGYQQRQFSAFSQDLPT